MLRKPSDSREVIKRAREGDREAFEQLFAGLEPELEAYVRSRLHPSHRSRIDAREVTADVLVRAFGSLGSFEGDSEEALRRWIFGIARIAGLKAAEALPGPGPLEIVCDRAGADPSPSGLLRREERLDRFQAALDTLRDDERQIIRLTRIDGLSMRDVAARLARSEDAVKQIFSRALRKLRQRMPETGSFHLPDRPLDLGEEGDGDARR